MNAFVKTQIGQRWIRSSSQLIIQILNSGDGEAIVCSESIWGNNVLKGEKGHWTGMYIDYWKLLSNQDAI